MSTFKCKMCGGTLEIQSGSTVAECEYCGAKQTLPKLDDEKRANLYDRANHFRRSNEFDKASAIYEQILAEDNTDAEAYWSLVLCRYGIEYVEDPLSHRRVPTVHRAQFTSIFDDDNYKSALKNSDTYQRVIYEEEAKAINEIQKGILAISQKEEPFDVFICYKETDDSGKRTHDSVLAQDLYYQLKQEGFKVFFARITLEDKLGSAYEPYIFAALNSAKVMVVLGTKPEFFNAVWVKNEWSRFLSLIKHGEKKMLIPAYKDMDPYDLPVEFSHLQAQDMSKLGFMQDLIRGIKKILGRDKKTAIPTVERVVVQGDGHAQDAAPLLRRAFLFCEDGEFDSADEYAEKVLDINPECAEAYVVKLLIELELKKPSDLAQCKAPISDSPNYQKVLRFATLEYRETIEGYNNAIIKRIDTARKDEMYACGVEMMKLHRYDEAVQYFQKIPTYKDSTQKIADCKRLKETERLDGIYQRATQLLNAGQFDEAARLFESIEDYKDSKEKIKLCGERKENARKDAIYSQAMNRVRPQNADDAAMKKSIEELQTISGYRDVDDRIRALNARLEKWYEDKKKAEEAARIKAEEDRRTREREAEIARIAAEKRKKKLIKTAKIGIPSVIALIVVLVLLFTWIIPLIRYNQADELLKKGKLEEADKIYRDLDGFSDSEQRIALINGTQKIQKGLFDAGITEILSAGIPVKINYGMNGGDFSGVAHVSMPQREEDISVKLLSASGEAGELPNENPDTVEASFTTVKDFNGVQTPERNGYYFSHWKFEKYNYELDGIFELSLSSVWSQRKYSIEYDLAGGKISGEKNLNAYYPESDVFTLSNPTRTGYTFAGWTGADLTEPTVEVTIPTGSYGNREYVATWKPNEYTINYDANGGTVSSPTQTIAYDSDVEYLIPERTGYTFLGWYDGDVKVENEKWIRTSDISLVAKWEIVGYTIGYEMNGGTNHSDNPSNYQVDTDTITLKYPSRTGYNFIGWTYEEKTTPIKDVAIEKGSVGNKTFTANWEAITTTVKFNADGGECETTSFSATYDQNITLPTVTKKGYTFLGWYNGNTKYQSGIWKTYTDIELTAKWQIVSYSISYSLGGGTNASANPSAYTIEQAITLKEPTRTGYEFLGWTYEGQTTPVKIVSIPKGTIGNKSYTANWKAITSTITFDANGGSCNKTTMSVTYNSSFTLPTPTWDGHTFSGWYNGNAKVTSGTCKLYSNTTLVARWDIVEYSITYTLKGGTNNSANPKTYTVEQTITLQEPTRTGYTFTGWTFEGQATPAKNITINIGTIGNKSYVANWEVMDELQNYNFAVYNDKIKITGIKDKTKTSCIIPNIVTGIDYNAFSGCTNLTSVYIDDIAAWYDISFSGSESNPLYFAKNLYLKNSFGTYDLVTELIVPNTVTKINAYAFEYCTSLTSVTIHDSVTGIGYNAFIGCNNLTSVTIGNNVTSIGSEAFDGCSSLTSVTIGNSVTSIGSEAFEGCSSLTSVTIGNSVTSIGSYAFRYCYKLVEVINKSSLNITKGYGIAQYALEVHNDESKIVNKDGYLFYTTGGTNYLLGYVGTDTDIVLTANYNGENYAIYKYAFYNNDNLTSVTIPDSVTSIGEGAFRDCSSLISIDVDENNTVYKSINGNLYSKDGKNLIQYAIGKTNTTFTIPDTVTNINDYAFYNCDNFVSVTISDGVKDIGEYAFYNCDSLMNLTIGNGVTRIGDYAFYNCDNFVSVTISDGVKDIGEYAFYNCDSLMNLTIGNGVTRIGDYAFVGCKNLTSVTIGNSVLTIGYWAFSHCDNLTSVIIPNSVTNIYSHAFYHCDGLTNVTLGDGTEYIGEFVFDECTSLTNITIPGSVKSISKGAFDGCDSLTRVYYNGGIANWCNISFNDLWNSNPMYYAKEFYFKNSNGEYELLTNLVIPDTVKYINNHAFYHYAGLTSVTLGNSVTSIGDYAFSGCENLASVTISNSVTSIGDYAFSSCSSLTSVTIPNSVTSIGKNAFGYCDTLTSVTGGNGVRSIGESAFYSCDSLTSVTIPDSVKSIGKNAFGYCDSLTNVEFKNTEGWKAGSTSISFTELGDKTKAAEYLTDTYQYSYWFRS